MSAQCVTQDLLHKSVLVEAASEFLAGRLRGGRGCDSLLEHIAGELACSFEVEPPRHTLEQQSAPLSSDRTPGQTRRGGPEPLSVPLGEGRTRKSAAAPVLWSTGGSGTGSGVGLV